MYSLGSSVVGLLTVVVFSGFVFHVVCQENHTQCFEVESKTICYFAPNVSSVDWDTAWKTCRELDATLPVILNENGQTVVGDYLSKYFPARPVWTAGRYIGSGNEWRWLNGRNFSVSDNPPCPTNVPRCPYETQAVVTKDLIYEARYPGISYAFICSYSVADVNCGTDSQKSIQWKYGCLSWQPMHRLPLNKARNECLKDGGDLATFSEEGDLQALRELYVSSIMKDNYTNEYWIGLHRKWWIWNTTDVHDIKYNLLSDDAWQGYECVFINDERGKWSQDTCSSTKNVICQTEIKERRHTSEDVSSTAFTGIVVGSVILALIVLILVIIIAWRKIRSTSKKADDQVDIDQTYEDLHNAGPIASVDTGVYTDLVPTQLRRNVDHHEDPLYEDL